MANLLLDILRSLATGAIADKVKEEASPYIEDVMRPAPPEKPMTEGYRYDDRGFPTRSSMIPAQTSGYVRPRADGVRGEAADPYVLDQMMREAVGEQRTREGELAQAMADEAAQKQASVMDFVRQAGQGTGTAQTAPYTPSGDDSAMFKSPNVQRMMMNPRIQATSAKIAEEAPELTPKQNLAATALEEVKKEGMLRKAKRAAGAPEQEGSTDMAMGMYPNGKPDESSSFFDEISGGLKDLFGTREGWMAIGAAANELRFAPSEAIRQGNQKIYEKRLETEKANKTAAWLRAKGTPNAITAAEYLEAGGKLKDAMDLFKGADYGLTPIKIMDEDNNIKLIQLNKNGQTREIELPAGYRPAPDIQKIDTGTGTVIVDKHGNQIGFVPKDVAGVEAAKELGKYTQEQINAAPQSYQNAKSKLQVINDFLDHPAFNDVFGAIQGRLPTVKQETLDAEAYLDQIKGAAFLAAFESLKGGGQISNVEGIKAEQAMARLKTAQSEKEARKALNELADILRLSMAKARQMAPDKVGQIESFSSPPPSQSAPQKQQNVRDYTGLGR